MRLVRALILLIVSPGAGAAGVPADCSSLSVALAAQQPPDRPAPQDEFVPIDQLPPQEELPAAPMVVAAYSFVWIAFVAYCFALRQARAQGRSRSAGARARTAADGRDERRALHLHPGLHPDRHRVRLDSRRPRRQGRLSRGAAAARAEERAEERCALRLARGLALARSRLAHYSDEVSGGSRCFAAKPAPARESEPCVRAKRSGALLRRSRSPAPSGPHRPSASRCASTAGRPAAMMRACASAIGYSVR